MKESTYRDYCESVELAVRHVHDHLGRPHSVSTLAKLACMSPYHFQRVFARVAGENCMEMVRRLRLERAAYQLQNSSRSISQIALNAGFSSQESFARSFRDAFAAPATEFREAKWGTFWLLAANGTHYTPNGDPTFTPLSRSADQVPFRIEVVDPFEVSGRPHLGSPHLMAKAVRVMIAELVTSGKPPPPKIITFAHSLQPGIPVSDVTSFVAIPREDDVDARFDRHVIGGGLHLLVPFHDVGPKLGDFWFRIWIEAMPASRMTKREGPCYQILDLGPRDEGESRLSVLIGIPVEPKGYC